MDGAETPTDRRPLSERHQATLVVLGVLVSAALLALAYFSFFRTPYTVLLSGLKPADAAAVVAVLQKEKTPYRLADRGTTVLVPEPLADASRLNIASSDIPLKGAVGFEIFNKSGMGLTDLAQRVNYQRALQGELSRTIMTLQGVDSARVHLSMPEQTIFHRDQLPAKASVTVVMQLGHTLAPSAVVGIQDLVASAVPGLDVGDVVVLDAQGAVVSADRRPTAAPASPERQQTQALEQYYAGKVRAALRAGNLVATIQVAVAIVPGPDDIAAIAPGPSVPAAPGTAAVTDDTTTDAMSPQARGFGLRVTLSAPDSLSPDERQKAVDVVRTAIAFDAVKGDDIAFGPLPGMPVPHPSWSAGSDRNAATPATPYPPETSSRPDDVSLMIAGGAGVALLVMALAWRWSNRRLSASRRRALAARLAHELNAQEQRT